MYRAIRTFGRVPACTCSPDRPCSCDVPERLGPFEIDPDYWATMVELGIAELAHYLRNHALFTEYLADSGRL